MSQLHNGTPYIRTFDTGEIKHIIGAAPGWVGHAEKEMKRRRKARKVAHESRRVNR
jgi:hypothetical protein